MTSDNANGPARALATAAILVFCLHVFSDNKADVDLWGNIGFVKAPAWSADFHRANTFSFTNPDHAWINHEWLAEYVLHATYENFGNSGLLALKVLLGLLVLSIMYCSIAADCLSGPVRFFYLLLTVSTMGYGFSTRPHHFTYLFLALFLLLLKKWPGSRRLTLFLTPVLGFVWANTHGAFFIGAIVMGIYIVLETSKTSHVNDTAPRHIPELAGALALFVVASFFNPFGLGLWRFVFESAGLFRPYLSEWAPFNRLEYLAVHPDFVVLVLISFAAALFSKRQKDITWIGILATSFVSAIVLRRNIPLFAITAAFVVPAHLDDIAAKPIEKLAARVSRRVVIALLSVFIAVTMLAACFFNKANPAQIETPPDRFPSETIAFMKENRVSGNALVFFDWAEYAIWHLYPDCKQFLDGRFSDAYDKRTIEDYFNFLYLGPNWDNALKNYPTDIVLVHRGNPVSAKMAAMDDWALICESDLAILFVRKDKHADLLAKWWSGGVRLAKTPQPAYFPD